MKTVWNWICRLFTKENVGIIWKTLFASAKNAAKKAINDPKVQARAFETAKTLMSADISGEAKKDAFNSAMKDFFAEYGKEVGTSTLNVIRELAVEAVKEAQEQEAAGSAVAPCLLAVAVLFGVLGANAAVTTNVTLYAAAMDTSITNVVTNVVFETHVRFDTYPVTNGYVEVYGGELTTNRVYDTPRYIWSSGRLALITNYVDTVVAGTETSRVYDVSWEMRPNYYPVAVTNVYTNVFVNGINVRR